MLTPSNFSLALFLIEKSRIWILLSYTSDEKPIKNVTVLLFGYLSFAHIYVGKPIRNVTSDQFDRIDNDCKQCFSLVITS